MKFTKISDAWEKVNENNSRAVKENQFTEPKEYNLVLIREGEC